MKKFSLIICYYNARDHIEGTLKSVVKLMEDVEVIFVDDGSDDFTYELINEELNGLEYKHIKLKQNYGTSYARSVGVKSSSSEWILFLDSDDSFIGNPIQILNDSGLLDSCDIIEFKGRLQSGEELSSSFIRNGSATQGIHYYNALMRNEEILDQLWLRAYRKQLFGENTFTEHYITSGEDTIALPLIVLNAKTICFLDSVLISVTERGNSVSRSYIDKTKENYKYLTHYYQTWLNHYDNYLGIQGRNEFYFRKVIQQIYHLIMVDSRPNVNYCHYKQLLDKYLEKSQYFLRKRATIMTRSKYNYAVFFTGTKSLYLAYLYKKISLRFKSFKSN